MNVIRITVCVYIRSSLASLYGPRLVFQLAFAIIYIVLFTCYIYVYVYVIWCIKMRVQRNLSVLSSLIFHSTTTDGDLLRFTFKYLSILWYEQ